MKDKIRWIFFDMGGVILDDTKPEALRQEILLKVSQRYFPDLTMENIYNAWQCASQQHGSVRINALRCIFNNSQNLEEAERIYKDECKVDYYGLSNIRPEARDMLAELSGHYNLGIMANQNEKAAGVLESAGILQYFSHQKMSGHIGLEKPDPEFYLEVLKDTGATPSESVLVDDNWYRGLLQAHKLGLHTILYKRDIIPVPKDSNPNLTVTSLTELLSYFKK